ncbi:Oxidoreductase N-terminal [Penicillium sp. DV-2018c]|nr:Oxidoreductase N-terminal [Penicillium sp. DV-2018c]
MPATNKILRLRPKTQVTHIPTLNFLSDNFQITYLCGMSLAHLCASPDVDVVLIASSDIYHVMHARLALQHNKFVFIETPMALSLQEADCIIEAEKHSSGKVMVGYMRRYASGFLDAVKEIGDIDQVQYARVRDIVWSDASSTAFFAQSGTFSKVCFDRGEGFEREYRERTEGMFIQALEDELGIEYDLVVAVQWRYLGRRGSHDLSAMREALGMPVGVLGASFCEAEGRQFWSALFQYPSFAVSYESGVDEVPRFDVSIEVFGENKTVKVCFDSPYVKGLPTTMHIREKLEDVSFQESVVRKTYEDAYTLEMKELYAVVVEGKPVKTTAEDARKDIEIFGMIMKAGVEGQARLNRKV